MISIKSFRYIAPAAFVCVALAFSSCKKDGNPNNLPPVDPRDYEGKVDGFSSSDEVFPSNLVAQWTFDDNANEKLTNTAPTATLRNTLVDGGVRGRALSLDSGFLYYATQFPKFTADSLKSFTISVWIKILNNGSKRTMLMQLARPGQLSGFINFQLNTQSFQATETNILRIQPTFLSRNNNFQDNLNNSLSPRIGLDKWTHLVLTYEITTGVFNIWADGVKVGAFPNRGTNNTFLCGVPNEFIIGANYNDIPNKKVNSDAAFAPMRGQVDEIRIYNRALPDAFILALFNLGKAKL
jgi:hypothetical protein